jgi:secreted PhoX family phosphatase
MLRVSAVSGFPARISYARYQCRSPADSGIHMTLSNLIGLAEIQLTRRNLLRQSAHAASGIGLSALGSAMAVPVAHADGADDFGPLQAADANGLQLPVGFTSRIVATSGQTVAGTGYQWHLSPDGGAVFPTNDGGWIYVSNAERGGGDGGVGTLVFDSDANIVAAYSILSGTSINCAGGPTPWGTWLSCEEFSSGQVYECNPYAASNGVVRPAMGSFRHEAAAVDPIRQCVYLTEDTPSGKLYRFRPTTYPDLSSGTLEVAQVADGSISVGQVKDLSWTPTVASGFSFNGGEGCWYADGLIYFSTKGDWRVWKIDTTVSPHTIEIYYDGTGTLTEPHNVYVAGNGDVYVAEDDGNLEIVALTQSGGVHPMMRLTGVANTEITGPALNPQGNRLYFSSQRNPGQTFEITGPFQPPPPAEQISSMGLFLRAMLGGAFAIAALVNLRNRTRDPD